MDAPTMKYVFVGDLHGKIDSAKAALDRDGTIVFVGDYLDSFDRSLDDQIDTLLTVMNAIDSGKAIGLFGNHELSYLVPHHRCSGYSFETQQEVNRLKERILKTLTTHVVINQEWFISHAGLHSYVDAAIHEENDNIQLMDTSTPWHWIGQSRGGSNLVGGIWWCDFNEEFVPVPGLNQIFGHSARGGEAGIRSTITEDSRNYCIDCLGHHPYTFLELDL